MPKSAATIFGLVLVAFSIGFNTWRYPIVWRMVEPAADPAAAGETMEPAASMSATPTAGPVSVEPAPATPPPAPATPGETKPSTDAASKPEAVASPPDASRPITAAMPVAETRVTGPASQEKPLVPVPRVVAEEKPKAAVESAAVRRLPPIDPSVPSPAAKYPSATSSGAIPIYPSTGIQ